MVWNFKDFEPEIKIDLRSFCLGVAFEAFNLELGGFISDKKMWLRNHASSHLRNNDHEVFVNFSPSFITEEIEKTLRNK